MIKIVKYICIIIGVAIGSPLYCQITLPNPSFELDDTIVWGSPAKYWDTCKGFSQEIVTITPSPEGFLSPPTPPDGKYYCYLGQGGNAAPSFITTKLNCPVLEGYKHHLSVWAMGYFFHVPTQFREFGYFTIHLGYTSCDTSQLIYTSSVMPDTLLWRKYEFDFIPHDNFAYIGIQAHHIRVNYECDVLIDNFSPITVEISNVAKINITGLQQTDCYNLAVATANNINLIRYQWKMNGSVFSPDASPQNICINQATTIYLTAWDACGYAYIDSLNINRNELIVAPNGNNLNLHITPFSEPLQLSLFNVLGQMISTETISEQTTATTLNTETLPKGVYFITLYNNHVLIKRKWMKVN